MTGTVAGVARKRTCNDEALILRVFQLWFEAVKNKMDTMENKLGAVEKLLQDASGTFGLARTWRGSLYYRRAEGH